MTTYTYQVEWQDELGKEYVVPYGNRLVAAISKARRESVKHMVAYVVSLKSRIPDDGTTVAVGAKSYGNGSHMETDGDGFAQ